MVSTQFGLITTTRRPWDSMASQKDFKRAITSWPTCAPPRPSAWSRSLMPFATKTVSARLPTPLSSVRVPLDQIAATAIDLIVNPGTEPLIRRSMPTLIPRQSSGRPKH